MFYFSTLQTRNKKLPGIQLSPTHPSNHPYRNRVAPSISLFVKLLSFILRRIGKKAQSYHTSTQRMTCVVCQLNTCPTPPSIAPSLPPSLPPHQENGCKVKRAPRFLSSASPPTTASASLSLRGLVHHYPPALRPECPETVVSSC